MSAIELGSSGVLAPGPRLWLRALGWMIALFVLLFLISAVPLAVRLIPHRPAWTELVIATMAALLCLVAYDWAVEHGEKRVPHELALRPLPRDLAIGALIGIGMFGLVFASLRLGGLYSLARGHWGDWPHDILVAALAGLIEELVFRAVVFRLLMRAFGMWPALLLSALIFGAMHMANPHATPFAGLAIAVEAGLMLASFYLLTGRIWMSVGVHSAWNFTQGAIFGATVSGRVQSGSLFVSAPAPGAPEMLSGGVFGPEASLPAILVGLGVFLIVLRAAARQGAVPGGRASAR